MTSDLYLLELVEPLRKLVPPAGCRASPLFRLWPSEAGALPLRRRGITTLIVTGDDVCAWPTVMAAADCGFHVVLPDAPCSGNDATH